MCIKLHSDKVVFVLLGITLLAVDGRHTYVRFQRQITDNHGSRASEDIAERHKRAGCETVTHYDVRCHDLCPIYDIVQDWKKNVEHWNCTPGTTYHCAKDDVTGKYVDACGTSVRCNRGTEPKIKFPEGHTEFAVILCETCSEDGYNPYEFKKSDTFSRCPRRLQCKDYAGEIECEAVTGIERSWTDSKCRCDIARNYIPTKHTENICTSHYSLKCYGMPPCKDTADGHKQQYLSSNYTCSPVCDERFYPRSLESDECVPIKRQDEGASERNLTNRTISEVHSTPTSTQAPINSSPDDQKNETNVTTQIPGYAETGMEIWIIMVVVSVGIVFVGLCVLYCLCCQDRNRQKGNDSPHEEDIALQEVNHADSPHEEENPLMEENHADSPHEEENPLMEENHADSPHEEDIPLQEVNHADSPHEEENPLMEENHADSPHEEENPLMEENHADSQSWINSISEDIRQAELTDPNISIFASCLGKNWELIAGPMGLSQVEMDHIKADNQTTANQISNTLHRWKNNYRVSHTLGDFLDILTKCTVTYIEWEKIKKYFDELQLAS